MASHMTPSLCGASVTVCFGGQGIVWPFQLCECSLWRPNLCRPQPSGNFSHLPPFSIPVGDLAFAICVPNSFKNLKLISILLVHESRLIHFVWRSMVSTPALLPRDLETQSQSKPAHSTLWLPSQFPPPFINRLSVCENCYELVFGLFTINVPTWMIYDTLAWFPCFVVTLWTASSLPNSSLHAAFLMTYYNETIHAFIYLPWRVTPAFPYPCFYEGVPSVTHVLLPPCLDIPLH